MIGSADSRTTNPMINPIIVFESAAGVGFGIRLKELEVRFIINYKI
jgi:hypothetical protein